MAVIENNGLLQCIDDNGNIYILYPITKLENVTGTGKLVQFIDGKTLITLDGTNIRVADAETVNQLSAQIADTVKTTSQTLTADQKSQARANIGLGSVDNVKQYSELNPPPYPVTSVNGKTGAVSLNANNVGARPSTWMPNGSEILASLGYVPANRDNTITITGKDTDGNTHEFTIVGWAGGTNEPA